MLNQRLQASNTDNMVMLAGLTRARGFRLDDYGVVFDVEFPSMRRSMVWSIQELEKSQRRPGGARRRARCRPCGRARSIRQRSRTRWSTPSSITKGPLGVARQRVADGRGTRKRSRSALRARRSERYGDHRHPAHQRERPAGPSRGHPRARGWAEARGREALLTGEAGLRILVSNRICTCTGRRMS